jgi:hypothetical protein
MGERGGGERSAGGGPEGIDVGVEGVVGGEEGISDVGEPQGVFGSLEPKGQAGEMPSPKAAEGRNERGVGAEKVKSKLGTIRVGDGGSEREEKLRGRGIGAERLEGDFAGRGEVSGGNGGFGIVEGDEGVERGELANARGEGVRGAPVGEGAESQGGFRAQGDAEEDAEHIMQNEGWGRESGESGVRFSGVVGGHASRDWKESEKGDGESKGGDVGKAVGDGVVGNGGESGDGEEEEEEPQDSEGGDGTGTADADGKEEESGEEDGVEDGGDEGEVRAGIEGGEMSREEGEMEVVGEGLGQVGDTGDERKGQAGLAVPGKGGGGGGGGEKEVGNQRKKPLLGERGTENEKVEEDKEEWKGNEGGFDEEGGGEKDAGEDVARHGSATFQGKTTASGEEGQTGDEGEEKGEDVFPFGNPGDGLDAEGVEGPEEGKEEGDRRQTIDARRRWEGGGHRGAGEAEEKEEEENGVGGVERDVDCVERRRVEGGCAQKGDVGHAGEPKEGHVHPDIGGPGGESRTDSGGG